jgi:hypothetical protein
MNVLASTEIEVAVSWNTSAQQACKRIAPTWPLDDLIAVNPWWEMRDQPMQGVAARLAALGNVHCLMPRSYYRGLWQSTILPKHLQQALSHFSDLQVDMPALLEHLDQPEPKVRWHTVSDQLDALQGSDGRMTWGDEIRHQISQFCASFLQSSQVPGTSLYVQWLNTVRADLGIQILMGEKGLQACFEQLPEDYCGVFEQAARNLGAAHEDASDYLHALLLDINGWASLCAYFDRYVNDAVARQPGNLLEQLLAIRLAWELVLWRHCQSAHQDLLPRLKDAWEKQWAQFPDAVQTYARAQALTWVWQVAAECAYREGLHEKLQRRVATHTLSRPSLQAVFCIDVRSEPFRRALEHQDPGIQTLGFAGFFGLPVRYQSMGSAVGESRLPGLLQPQFQVTETAPSLSGKLANRAGLLNRKARLQGYGTAAPSTFNLVESIGLGYAFKLLKDSFFPGASDSADLCSADGMRWELTKDGKLVSITDRAAMAARVLRGMGLTTNFAPHVLLLGHGSSSRNNPHASGLDCGACGGHAGDLNARVLAMLLNDPEVRRELQGHDIRIPGDTLFIPGLHDTTTDAVRLFDHTAPGALTATLQAASVLARRRRAPSLGLADTDDAELEKQLIRRSRDWSQPRPEWGLANNAGFIAAPRCCLRHLDLNGRVFLHDYDWHNDHDFSVLELIMTAPMVVAQWINMQYYASVTDHQHYGSGNKILHNVVGGRLGVFEGNGGDLRIGLPIQSVHDGERWRHEPLRLAVYLAAPAQAISAVYERHPVVRQLVDNQWLHLYRLDDDPAVIEYLKEGRWHTV